ncbi:MAG: ATP-binding protein [Lachnospiraceae bacterium]|nr:ATP-binding protein [Lachnospiraceae bacterium]
MAKKFNTTGACIPAKHYMVDLTPLLEAIKEMIDEGDYFTINRARQYGKTTTLRALRTFLKGDYIVASLDFQRMGSYAYENEFTFVQSLSSALIRASVSFPKGIKEQLESLAQGTERILSLQRLFQIFEDWCAVSERPVVLLIDEVDTATNNQIFLDFLAQLRAAYLDRDISPTFQSVVLAGVYDVRNIKRKIRPEEEYKENSPWNIAAKFLVEMTFSAKEIGGMIRQYEEDYHTGMCVDAVAETIYDYTSGYPVLSSELCKLLDEEIAGTDEFPDRSAAWTAEGLNEAVKLLLTEKNALFESLWDKLNRYPEMKERIYDLLFRGAPIPFNIDDPVTNLLSMFGFVKNEGGTLQISNRIFETRLYNYFLMTADASRTDVFQLGSDDKNQFVTNGQLDMECLLGKFVKYFDDIYGDRGQKFVEDDGRRYFMLFLKPIINGTGNYYVEARTRNRKQTDLIIDYHGEQLVIELKIWRGNAYNERGEEQLAEYLDYYHLKKGYMLSFCFNKNKKIGVKEVTVGDRLLVEAVV